MAIPAASGAIDQGKEKRLSEEPNECIKQSCTGTEQCHEMDRLTLVRRSNLGETTHVRLQYRRNRY